jgi:TonB-dependent starch-binding outer membrane protein SusC
MKSDVYNLLKLNTLAKKVLFLTGILFLSVTFTLTAQEVFNFSGMVQGENGEALPGVNVVEKGTTNGTISGIDGTFQINLNKKNILFVFSMIGYETIEKELKANVKEIIVLKESIVGLSEVLVVGYGIQKRSNITGAIAKLGQQRTCSASNNQRE